MIETKVNLTEYQIKKIAAAYKKRAPVTVHLSYEQFKGNGKHKILLTETPKKKMDKSIKLKKGFELELSNEKIKTGGFLPFILAALPEIATVFGGLAGEGAAIASAVNNAKHQRAEKEEIKLHNK